VQTAAELHDTPLNAVLDAPRGSGVAWMLQAVPSQASANPNAVFELFRYNPTALHALAELHDTLNSSARVAPAGAGVAWMLQAVPFHASANGRELPELMR
jgi:hypothetical protein